MLPANFIDTVMPTPGCASAVSFNNVPSLPPRLPDAQAQQGAQAVPLLQREDRTLSPLERMSKAVLIATTRRLPPQDVVHVHAASHALHAALAEELLVRRDELIRDLIVGWSAQVLPRIQKAKEMARANHPWDLMPLEQELTHLGHWQESAVVRAHPAHRRPNVWTRVENAENFLVAGNGKAALAEVEAGLDGLPFRPIELCDARARGHLLQGDARAAREALADATTTEPVTKAIIQVMIAHALGEPTQALVRAAVAYMVAFPAGRWSRLAEMFAFIGDAPSAIACMRKAVEVGFDHDLARIPLSKFTLPIAEHPLWKPLREHAERVALDPGNRVLP